MYDTASSIKLTLKLPMICSSVFVFSLHNSYSASLLFELSPAVLSL